jgi:hypothetical protein
VAAAVAGMQGGAGNLHNPGGVQAVMVGESMLWQQ